MSLRVAKFDEELPSEVVKLTRSEALSHQTNLIENWSPVSDVFFLKHGKEILITVGAASSIITTIHFRKPFRLKNTFSYLLALPGCLSAAAMGGIAFPYFITENILLMTNTCAICQEMKFISTNILSTFVYPIIVSSLGSAAVAILAQTCYVPDITKQPHEFYRLLLKYIMNGKFKFQMIITTQIFVTLLVTFMQSKEMEDLMKKIEDRSVIQAELISDTSS